MKNIIFCRDYGQLGRIRYYYIEKGYLVKPIKSYWFFGRVYFFKYEKI